MTLYIPVGIPGSGKSYLAQQMVEAGLLADDAIISPDYFRLLLTGDMSNQDVNRKVFSIVDDIILSRMKYNQDVYVDATNLQMSSIHKYVGISPPEMPIVIMPSTTENSVSRQRNAQRERVVPDKAMDKMEARYNEQFRRELYALADQHDLLAFCSMDDMLANCYRILYSRETVIPFPADLSDAAVDALLGRSPAIGTPTPPTDSPAP